MKPARNLKPKSKPISLDLHEEEEEEVEERPKRKTRFQEESPEEENDEDYSKDDLLAWLGKGPGKGKKGSNPKGGKGKDGKGVSKAPATIAACTGTVSTSAGRRTPT